MNSATLSISSAHLRVDISKLGAEIQSIRSNDGASWLWHGDPAHWAGRAPILFPVIGRSPDSQVSIDGKFHPMPPHGFALTSEFCVREALSDRCQLRLAATSETRVHYPFNFTLDVSFEVKGMVVLVQADVVNLEDRSIPVCIGFHPAFPWPMVGCSVDELHLCRLDHRGSPPVRRLDENGLMLLDSELSLFHEGKLKLDQTLFSRRAIILDTEAGSTVQYGVCGKPGIEVAFWGLPHLGIWSKPGAPFLCIEPWQGLPPLVGDSAALELRPGTRMVPPGANHHVAMALRFGAMVA